MNIYACAGDLGSSPVGSEGNSLSSRYGSLKTFLHYHGIGHLVEYARKHGYDKVSVYRYTNFYDNKTFTRLMYRPVI